MISVTIAELKEILAQHQHADCLSLVARCKAMALARGWKLEGGS